jgi:hypothetical protein
VIAVEVVVGRRSRSSSWAATRSSVVVVDRAATKRWPPRFARSRDGCVKVSSPIENVTVAFRLVGFGSVICEARMRIAYSPGPTSLMRAFFSPGPFTGGK